jgi:hypothetical protein
MEEYLDNQIQEDAIVDEVEVVESDHEDNEEIGDEETPSSEELSQAEKDFLEVQYNKEVIRLDKEKAKEYAQKGMNYDKVKERLSSLENDPRLAFVDSQAKKYGLTADEYLRAVAEQQVADEIEQLADEKGLPEDVARELYESKKFREQYMQQQQQQTFQQKQQQMMQEFITAYPEVKAESIPQEVWQLYENGVDLVSAYARHESKLLRQQLAELKEAKKVNQENELASTGSIKGQGSPQNLTFTREQVERMTPEQAYKNYNQIIESMKNW